MCAFEIYRNGISDREREGEGYDVVCIGKKKERRESEDETIYSRNTTNYSLQKVGMMKIIYHVVDAPAIPET
jgi:hypothetical protein